MDAVVKEWTVEVTTPTTARPTRVILFGLGQIGQRVARVVSTRQGFEIIGAVDVDPEKIDQSVAEVCGDPNLPDVPVSSSVEEIDRAVGAVALHTTGSHVTGIVDELTTLARHKVNVVSSAEELLEPWARDVTVADAIDKTAREQGVTIVGAVSPPGGDFSEPVTQSTMRVTGALWALDSSLAHRRHYPAINWHRSYTLYSDRLASWYSENVSSDWSALRTRLIEILDKDAELQEVVQLVGPDALQDNDRLVLEVSRMLRDGFLQQNAMSDVDAACPFEKQRGMLKLLLAYYDLAAKALEADVPLERMLSAPVREELSRLRDISSDDFPAEETALAERMDTFFRTINTEEKAS